MSNENKGRSRRPPEEKVRIVMEATALGDDELGTFLRREGLHAADLARMRAEVRQAGTDDEGVIKFGAEHRQRALAPSRFGALACTLQSWREVFAKLQLVGQEPDRYGGAGYGNVSARVGPLGAVRGRRAMLITGTQTGGVAHLELGHFCFVERYDYQRNRVWSEGAIQPSSETMTHGAIYDLSPAIRFVFHAHSPVLWRNAEALRIPTTDPRVPYGTPEMAREVGRLHASSTLSAVRILSMGGHEDGIICFGQTAEEAGETMVRYLARAYELVCRVGPRD